MARNGRLIAAEAYALHRAYIADPALPIDPWVRARTLSGKAIGAADYIDELAQRRRAAARFAEWMRGRDALLSPTLPITATPVADVDESTTPLATFTRAANYLGACALSLPAGFSAGGLPIGVQLMGAPFAEATLIAIGRAYQRATDWHLRRPDLPRGPEGNASSDGCLFRFRELLQRERIAHLVERLVAGEALGLIHPGRRCLSVVNMA